MVNPEDFSKKPEDDAAKKPDTPPSENDSDEEEDWDSEEDQIEDTVFVTCPCCGADFTELPPDCDHILIEYDQSFCEFSCDYFFGELYDLKSGMLELMESGKQVSTDDEKLQAIWDFAKESYEANPGSIQIDTDTFMDFLSKNHEAFGASRCYMNEEEGAPGYSSSYVYYFAEDPEDFIKNVTDHLLAVYSAG